MSIREQIDCLLDERDKVDRAIERVRAACPHRFRDVTHYIGRDGRARGYLAWQCRDCDSLLDALTGDEMAEHLRQRDAAMRAAEVDCD